MRLRAAPLWFSSRPPRADPDHGVSMVPRSECGFDGGRRGHRALGEFADRCGRTTGREGCPTVGDEAVEVEHVVTIGGAAVMCPMHFSSYNPCTKRIEPMDLRHLRAFV